MVLDPSWTGPIVPHAISTIRGADRVSQLWESIKLSVLECTVLCVLSVFVCTLWTLCVSVYSVYSLCLCVLCVLCVLYGNTSKDSFSGEEGGSFDSSPAKKTQKNDEKKVSKLILWRDSVMQFCSPFCSLFKYLFTSYAVDKAILNPFSILQRLQKKTLQIHWYSIRFSFIFKELSLYQKEALLRNCCRRFFMIKKNSLEYWSFIVKLQWLNSVYGHVQGLTIYLLVILDVLKTAEL